MTEAEAPAPQKVPNDPPEKESYSGFMDMINSEDENLFPNVVNLPVFKYKYPQDAFAAMKTNIGFKIQQEAVKEAHKPPNDYQSRKPRALRREKKATRVRLKT